MSTGIERPILQPQFENAEQQERSTLIGMWLFLSTEVLFFGGLFAAYAMYRLWYPEGFAAGSHHLDLRLGTVNTALLLLSSYLVALAVAAAKTELRSRWARVLLGVAAALGVAFLMVKGIEWHHVWKEGFLPGSSNQSADLNGGAEGAILFFSLYFTMTGLHALHVAAGVALLGFMACVSGGEHGWRRRAGNRSAVELSGLYWHFVDIVWLFLFPLLYLIERGAS